MLEVEEKRYILRHPTGSMVAYLVARHRDMSVLTLPVNPDIYRWKTRLYQGSQRHGKSWKTWKKKKAFSRPGKIMEFEKKSQNHGKIMELQNTSMEKSWKICLSCARIIQKKIPIMIMKLVLFHFFVEKMEATVRKVKCYTTNHNFCVALIMEKHERIMENHGKIMQFDSQKLLGTLSILLMCPKSWIQDGQTSTSGPHSR